MDFGATDQAKCDIGRCDGRDPRRLIAEQGYDPKMGARPMARVIQEQIKRPLAEQLLFGDLTEGGHVMIVVNDEGELELKAMPEQRQLEHKADEPDETSKARN